MKVLIKRADAVAVETIANITAADRKLHIANSDLDNIELKDLNLIYKKKYYLAITLKQDKIFKDNKNMFFYLSLLYLHCPQAMKE